MSTNKTNVELKAMVARMLAAWRGPIPHTLATVVVRGESLTSARIAQKLQAFYDLLDAPERARQALRAAVAQRDAEEPAEWRFFDDLSSVVVQHLGDGEALKQFGMPLPKEPARPSTETLVIANVKRQDTRRVRGIRGSRQRAAISTTPQPTLVVHGLPPSPPPTAPSTERTVPDGSTSTENA